MLSNLSRRVLTASSRWGGRGATNRTMSTVLNKPDDGSASKQIMKGDYTVVDHEYADTRDRDRDRDRVRVRELYYVADYGVVGCMMATMVTWQTKGGHNIMKR